MNIELSINDESRSLDIAPGATLLDVLRDAGFQGVKRGCEEGTCCSCVVLVDGLPQASCLLFAAGQEGRAITTIESLDDPERPHPLIEAFVAEGAVQCGYCVPGMILSAKVLLEQNPQPEEAEIRDALDGHLCRCTGYVKQIKAIQRAADVLAARQSAHGEEAGR